MLRNPLITSNLRLRQVAIIPVALLKVPERMGVEEARRIVDETEKLTRRNPIIDS